VAFITFNLIIIVDSAGTCGAACRVRVHIDSTASSTDSYATGCPEETRGYNWDHFDSPKAGSSLPIRPTELNAGDTMARA
jgi:hypothetical protein